MTQTNDLNTSVNAADIPRPEHPRPDFQRGPWLNLNGRWRFTFDPANMGEQKRWHHKPHPGTRRGDAPPLLDDPFGGEIVVPFPWESALSGIGNTDYRGAGWYQCTLTVPSDWQGSAWLLFGAVDWCARVWVNGRFVGEHFGGYTPFELDLSGFAAPGVPVTLTVRAWDNCDADTLLGKQTWDWYTPSSGIWQTVYLENRPYKYIENFQVTSNINEGSATFAVDVCGTTGQKYSIVVESPDGRFETARFDGNASTSVLVKVTVPNAKLWTPEEPNLYDAVVKLESEGEIDTVHTYFGLRSIGRKAVNGNAFEYFLLNGEPIYLRGALDQAFTPQGLHTYASDDAIKADIQLAKDLGLNMLRCHIKLNEPRYYYWADKLGMTIWYDMPCASIYTKTARVHWQEAFEGAVRRDFNHPSIIAWILFNETWGLEEHQNPESWRWVRDMYTMARGLDPTRLSEDNSACNYDHVKTDINTWHFYIADYERARHHIETVVNSTFEGSTFNYVSSRHRTKEEAQEYKQGREPLLNSEYAGLGASGGDRDVSHTFQFLTGLQRRHPIICGYVYTELTDIEWEHNGFANYDRTKKDFGYDSFVEGMSIADLNGADFVGFDCAPIQTLAPGLVASCAPFVSHWDRDRDLSTGAKLVWQLDFSDRFGQKRMAVQQGEGTIAPRRYDVFLADAISVTMPSEPGIGTLSVKLMDAGGNIVARNFICFDVFDQRAGAGDVGNDETIGGTHYLRFEPGDYTASSWAQPSLGPRHGKFGASGSGWVEYEVALPEGLSAESVMGLKIVFEAGSRTAHQRIGWKRPWAHGWNHYPQTHETGKIAGDVALILNGISVGTAVLPDDPADCRGVLTLQNAGDNFEFASYGFLTTVEATVEAAREAIANARNGVMTIRFEVPPTGRTYGLNLYGSRLGAYAVTPSLILETQPQA